MSVRFAAVLTALLLAASPALADIKDAVMNKEGYWAIDVDGDSCAGSMTLQGGSVFLLRGTQGDVAAALFSQKQLPKGKTLTLEADAQAIDLPATLTEERTVVYFDGALDAAALGKLRGARQLRVLIDKQPVAVMTLEGTGFSDAVDSLVACSQGKAGWWGKGVTFTGPTAETSGEAYNEEDIWRLSPIDGGGCLALAETQEKGLYLEFIQKDAQVTIAVMSSGPPLRRGRKGLLLMDGKNYNFAPYYPDETLMIMNGSLIGAAIDILKATTGLRLMIDGKALVDVNLTGTGYPKILDELAACSRGETGWWTANSAQYAH